MTALIMRFPGSNIPDLPLVQTGAKVWECHVTYKLGIVRIPQNPTVTLIGPSGTEVPISLAGGDYAAPGDDLIFTIDLANDRLVPPAGLPWLRQGMARLPAARA